jgi:hypothetical protein
MLRPWLKIWVWGIILGRVLQAISLSSTRPPWFFSYLTIVSQIRIVDTIFMLISVQSNFYLRKKISFLIVKVQGFLWRPQKFDQLVQLIWNLKSKRRQNNWEIMLNFCGLLRKPELYVKYFQSFSKKPLRHSEFTDIFTYERHNSFLKKNYDWFQLGLVSIQLQTIM